MFAGLVPHTDRCHLCDSDSVPSQWPIMRKAQCLGYSRDGEKNNPQVGSKSHLMPPPDLLTTPPKATRLLRRNGGGSSAT